MIYQNKIFNNIYMESNRILKSLNTENNCSDFSKNNFVVNTQTQLNDDKCHNLVTDRTNYNINDYMLSNFASCDCKLDGVINVSTNNQGLTVKDGYGVSNCNIDDDSSLRVGNVERHYKSSMQLFPRPFLTTPNTNRGKVKPDLESKLLSSLQSIKHKQLQNVDEKRVYTPLTENLQRNIQSPKHIIHESVNRTWVRGGIPSRQTVKDIDYFSRSTDNNVVKNLLRSRKQYL
jgi:hypothetical protein